MVEDVEWFGMYPKNQARRHVGGAVEAAPRHMMHTAARTAAPRKAPGMTAIPEPDSRLALHRRCIAVPESRELDIFATLLERRRASVLRCPLIEIRNAPDSAAVLNWLQLFCAGSCDDLIIYTGEGLRRLVDAIDEHAPQLRTAFIAQLGSVRTIARGPKPGRVLREWGLLPQSAVVAFAVPTTLGANITEVWCWVITKLAPMAPMARRKNRKAW